MTNCVIIALQKGGVGKTTSTVAIAEILAETGYRVLVVDADSQGNATRMLTGRSIYENSGRTIIAASQAGDAEPYIQQIKPGLDLNRPRRGNHKKNRPSKEEEKNMKNKLSAAEQIAAMKREKEAASKVNPTELVGQLTYEDSVEPDFTEIAKKLEERQATEKKGENEGFVKMTIYVRQDIAKAFSALITKRGQQKEFTNRALADFVAKKIRELDMDEQRG